MPCIQYFQTYSLYADVQRHVYLYQVYMYWPLCVRVRIHFATVVLLDLSSVYLGRFCCVAVRPVFLSYTSCCLFDMQHSSYCLGYSRFAIFRVDIFILPFRKRHIQVLTLLETYGDITLNTRQRRAT